MSQKLPRNVAASIQTRLLQLAKQRAEDYNYLLMRYASDRLLYRLSQSQYQQKFILKGATLFRIWNGEPHRATKDLDLLGYGINEVSDLVKVFQQICCVPCEEDGIRFQEETVTGERIKEEQEYEGVRLKLKGKLGSTSIPIQIDIGFGDAITPSPKEVEFSPILDLPAPRLQIYPPETVVAEKFQAMVSLGIANSRLKDFYDIWFLCQNFEFQGYLLSKAIQATFERRKTYLPTTEPLALTIEFAENSDKQKQWQGFLNKGQLKSPQNSLSETIAIIKDFLMPPCLAVAKNEEFSQVWIPPGTWQQDDVRSPQASS
jgi:predicted nucleotidyltransferase component of viral defense system